MPDELDKFSDIVDAFSNSTQTWREEYDARLDAIYKQLGNYIVWKYVVCAESIYMMSIVFPGVSKAGSYLK